MQVRSQGGRTSRKNPKFCQVHFLRSTFLHFILAANLVDNLRTLTLKLMSQNPIFYLQNEQFANLILRQIIKFVATICQLLRLKCTKFKFGWGSASNPAEGAYSAPQTL